MLESPPPRPPPIRANCFAGWPAWELDLGLAVLFTWDPATGPGSPPVQSLPDSPSLERHLIFHPREAHVLLKALGCPGGAAVVCFRGVSYPGAPLVPRSNNLLQGPGGLTVLGGAVLTCGHGVNGPNTWGGSLTWWQLWQAVTYVWPLHVTRWHGFWKGALGSHVRTREKDLKRALLRDSVTHLRQ